MEGVAKCSISDGPGNGPVTVSETDLYVAHRHEHFPMLHVRVARVEDTDDLMPIFTQSSEAGVDKQYGEGVSERRAELTFQSDAAGHGALFFILQESSFLQS